MMKRLTTISLIITLAVLFQGIIAAQGVKTVTGESTFYGEGSHSLNECKRLALEQARIAALAREFGTTISQDTYSNELVSGSNESSYFSMLNLSEVNGEWLGDEGAPEYTIDHDADHNPIVKCRIKGKARRLTNEAVQFDAEVLRNGNERRFADTRFRSGDEMKLYVRAPVGGYVSVYLIDDKRNVYSILPYANGTDGTVRISRDRDYVFFDPATADPIFGEPDEFTMTVEDKIERNQIYVIFSPNDFTRARDNTNGSSQPRTLSYEDFTKWLLTTRKRDPKMGLKVINLEVTK